MYLAGFVKMEEITTPDDAREIWGEFSNPVNQFVKLCTTPSNGDKIPRSTLYSMYLAWAGKNSSDDTKMSKDVFNKHLANSSIYETKVMQISNVRTRYLINAKPIANMQYIADRSNTDDKLNDNDNDDETPEYKDTNLKSKSQTTL